MATPDLRNGSNVSAWRSEIERAFSRDHDLDGVGTETLTALVSSWLNKDAVGPEELTRFMLALAKTGDDTADVSSRIETRALALGACAWLFMPAPTEEEYERFARANKRTKNGPLPKYNSLRIRQAWAYYHYQGSRSRGTQQSEYSYKGGDKARTLFRDALLDAVERYVLVNQRADGASSDTVGAVASAEPSTVVVPVDLASKPAKRTAGLSTSGRVLQRWAANQRRHRQLILSLFAALVLVGGYFTAVNLHLLPWSCAASQTACRGGGPRVATRSPTLPTGSPIESAETAVASTAWGPPRPFVTRAAGSAGIEFNSMLDNSGYGNESKFFKLKGAGDPDSSYTDELSVQPGNKYDAMVWFHNDAGGSSSVATKAKVRVAAPGSFKGSTNLDVFVSAANAVPSEVWESGVIALSSPDLYAALDYVQGTAILHTGGAANGTVLDASELFGKGVTIGCNRLDGNLPSGTDCEGWVSFQFSVNAPNFVVAAAASATTGKASFQDHLAVHPDEVIELRVEYVNTGTTQQDNVTVKFGRLPPGLRYIPGSVVIANTFTPGGKYVPSLDAATQNGINIGSYAPTGNAYVRVDVEVETGATSAGQSTSRWINIDPAVTVYTSGGPKTATVGLVLLGQ